MSEIFTIHHVDYKVSNIRNIEQVRSVHIHNTHPYGFTVRFHKPVDTIPPHPDHFQRPYIVFCFKNRFEAVATHRALRHRWGDVLWDEQAPIR